MTVTQDSGRKAINSREQCSASFLLATGLKSQSWLNIKVGTFYSLSPQKMLLPFAFLDINMHVGTSLFSLGSDMTLIAGHWWHSKYFSSWSFGWGTWRRRARDTWSRSGAMMWPAKVFSWGIFADHFGFLINIFVHCLDLLSVVFWVPQKQRVTNHWLIWYWKCDFLWIHFNFEDNYNGNRLA